MEPLFGLSSEVANTIITAIASLASAFLGGYIAARATKKSTERALNSSMAVQEDNRRAVLRGVILGIRTELEAILELYRSEMETELSELKSGQGVWTTLPIYESYFTVYESNCSLLGQINDDELRKAIIQAYLAAKSLVNTHQHNNHLIANHEKLVRESAAAFYSGTSEEPSGLLWQLRKVSLRSRNQDYPRVFQLNQPFRTASQLSKQVGQGSVVSSTLNRAACCEGYALKILANTLSCSASVPAR